jgi:hypothetical protein
MLTAIVSALAVVVLSVAVIEVVANRPVDGEREDYLIPPRPATSPSGEMKLDGPSSRRGPADSRW